MQESIDLLLQAGIDHITYEGYWRGKDIDLNQFDYAITPNMLYVCPHPFKHVINLQQKALSVRTFVEILVRLGIDLNYADIFENRYFRLHINTCRKVVQALDHSEQLSQAQSLILDQVDEALISSSSKGQFLFANQCAKRFFGLDEQFNISTGLRKAIRTLDKVQLQDVTGHGMAQSSQDVIITVDGSQFLSRKNVIASESGEPQIFYTFRKTEQIQEMERTLRSKLYAHEFSAHYTFQDIWGNSPKILQNKVLAKMFAKTDQTILITGESGSGKELMAQAIHNASPRASAPFVGINLAAISRSLLESELFGYEAGAFTGARKSGKAGLFEIANHGTIFLDEIGDAPLSVQVLLLRVLEERVITRVGGLHQFPIDVRVIAATNQPLHEMIKTGKFRADLYYRLNVLSIQTQPVREMKEEIAQFVQQYGQRLGWGEKAFSNEATRILQEYNWPGNFRELKNVAEYLYYTTSGQKEIAAEMLPKYLLQEVSHETEIQYYDAEYMDVFFQNPLLLQVLRLLRDASPRCVGRGYLKGALAGSGYPASEREIKRCLSDLQQRGLVHVGSTRQGTSILERGVELLDFYKDI